MRKPTRTLLAINTICVLKNSAGFTRVSMIIFMRLLRVIRGLAFRMVEFASDVFADHVEYGFG